MGKDGDNRDDGVSHFTIPSGPELRHESFELPVGEIKSEHTGRRLARTPPYEMWHFLQFSVFVLTCAK